MFLRQTFEDSAVQSVDEILNDVFPRSQRELDHEIARSTGEDLAEIRRHGFSPLTPRSEEFDPEDHVIDWDALERERNVPLEWAA
jgi:hypothetical protein